jgi:hypothetical protein
MQSGRDDPIVGKPAAMSDEIMDTLPSYQGNRKTTVESPIGDLFFIRCSPKVFRSLRA